MKSFWVDKDDVKRFRGHMTSVVQFIYENSKDKIRFRSVHNDIGNVSRIKLKGTKISIYATVDTVDAYKKLVDYNPRATLTELAEMANNSGKAELIEVANYFLEQSYKERVPILEIDTDYIK